MSLKVYPEFTSEVSCSKWVASAALHHRHEAAAVIHTDAHRKTPRWAETHQVCVSTKSGRDPVYSVHLYLKTFKVWRQICAWLHQSAGMWKTKSKNICKNITHNIKPLNFIWWVCTYSCRCGRFLITSLWKYTVIIWPWLIWDQWACSINAESEHSMQLRELQQARLLLLNDAFIG